MMSSESFSVYILSNKSRSTFYIGSTNNLYRRLLEHRRGKSWFSARYNLGCLVYYEVLPSLHAARDREKQLKNWHREWKINLIRQKNPEMIDLTDQVTLTSRNKPTPERSDAEMNSALTNETSSQ